MTLLAYLAFLEGAAYPHYCLPHLYGLSERNVGAPCRSCAVSDCGRNRSCFAACHALRTAFEPTRPALSEAAGFANGEGCQGQQFSEHETRINQRGKVRSIARQRTCSFKRNTILFFSNNQPMHGCCNGRTGNNWRLHEIGPLRDFISLNFFPR